MAAAEHVHASPSLPPSTTRAPIYKLPVELWRAIARAVHEVDEDWRHDGTDSNTSSGEGEDTLEGAALEVSLPLYWSHLDFDGDSTPRVESFIREILPKHGQHVLELYFRVKDDDLSDDESDADDEAYEHFRDRLASEERERRFKQLLVLIAGMPNLEEINVDVDDDHYENELLLKAALVSRRHTLRRLFLEGVKDDIIKSSWLAEVVGELDALEGLNAEHVGPPAVYDDPALAHAFNRSKISLLTVNFSNCFTPAFVREFKPPSLRILDLENAFIDAEQLDLMLDNVAPTLVHLNLVCTPYPADDPLGAGKPYRCVTQTTRPHAHSMPKLKELRIVESMATIDYLKRFASNPVRRLGVGPCDDPRLGFDADHDDKCLPVDELADYLRTKAAFVDLQEFILHAIYADQDSPIIKAACVDRGLKYSFIAEPYDDDDTDDEDADSLGLGGGGSDIDEWQTDEDEGQEDDDDDLDGPDDLDDFGA